MPISGVRSLVTPPVFTPLGYGLLSVAEPASAGELASPHWRAGIQMQPDFCGVLPVSNDICVSGVGTTKTALAAGLPIRGADAFTVYAWLNCGPVGSPADEQVQRVQNALTRNENYTLEWVFATGQAPPGMTTIPVVYPHLAADTAVMEGLAAAGGVLLQPAASTVTGAVVDIVEGLGRLEAAIGACYGGVPTLHIPQVLGPALAANSLVTRSGQYLVSQPSGSKIALGQGYPGWSPAGAAPAAGTAWIYATGAVKYWRTPVQMSSTWAQAVNRSVNDLVLIAERTYAILWDCCLHAIPISLGGVITGTFNSAT